MTMEKNAVFSKEDTLVIKGMAILLMFCHHLFAFPDRIAEGNSYQYLFLIGEMTMESCLGSAGKLCVALFLFLGGYGTWLGCRKTDRLYRAVFSKIRKLYIVYWQVFVIFIPICIWRGLEHIVLTPEAFVGNFLGLKCSYNGEWWFFLSYVELLLLFPLLRRLSDRFSSWAAELAAAAGWMLVALYVLPGVSKLPWAQGIADSFLYKELIITSPLLPVFWMGCMFAKHDFLGKGKAFFAGKLLAVPLGILGVLLALVLRYFHWFGVLDFLLAPLFTLAMTVLLNNPVGNCLRKGLILIGKESTICWLTHSFYCYQLCQKFVFAPRYSLLIVALLLVMCLLTSKGITWLYAQPGKLLHRKVSV